MPRRDRSNYLFSKYNLFSVIEAQKQALDEGIKGLSNDRIQSTEESQLVAELKREFYLDPLVIKEEDIEVEQRDTKIDVTGSFDRLAFGPGPHEVDGIEVSYYVPFLGDPDLLQCQPSRFTSMTPYAEIEGHNLIIRVDIENIDTENPESQMQGDLNRIKDAAGWVNDDIAQFNQGVEDRVRGGINARKEQLAKVHQVIAGGKYKMRDSNGKPSTYATTAVERRAPLQIESSSGAHSPEPVLSPEQYNHMLEVIKQFGHTMERTPATYKNMGEEEVRDIILANLNSHYKGKANAEAFNAGGKTDILIRDEDRNIFIGECKIWGGDKLFSETIDQLLGYTSWRDTKTALIIFNRNKDLSAVLEKIPDLVKAHPNIKREQSKVDETDFRYVLHHNDDNARELYMAVIVLELPS